MRYKPMWVVVFTVVATSCSTPVAEVGQSQESQAYQVDELDDATSRIADQGTTKPEAGVDDDGAEAVTEDDVVVFLAAGEKMLAAGPYEGLLYESPDLYVAAAQSVCSRLSDGMPVQEVVYGFVDDSQLDVTSEADLILAGTVVGAGVRTLCPDHLPLLEP